MHGTSGNTQLEVDMYVNRLKLLRKGSRCERGTLGCIQIYIFKFT